LKAGDSLDILLWLCATGLASKVGGPSANSIFGRNASIYCDLSSSLPEASLSFKNEDY